MLDKALLARSLAAWRLSMRLAVQSVEDRRRHMRCMMMGRAYIMKLRGKLVVQAAWLRWYGYWRVKPGPGPAPEAAGPPPQVLLPSSGQGACLRGLLKCEALETAARAAQAESLRGGPCLVSAGLAGQDGRARCTASPARESGGQRVAEEAAAAAAAASMLALVGAVPGVPALAERHVPPGQTMRPANSCRALPQRDRCEIPERPSSPCPPRVVGWGLWAS
mmetsp:Transcript_5423/g.16240  ORF Transcript_5423/g.16240 Transcript_5423/m.16240 type:complete len:221 (+) Transcript_5423:143-805(+)